MGIGDQVLIERAGDVIPYIVKSMGELRKGKEKKVIYPTHCPSCNTKLVREEDEAAWRCPNEDCKAQLIQRLIFHVSKDAMDIDGFGEKYILRFYELGWIKSFADIYGYPRKSKLLHTEKLSFNGKLRTSWIFIGAKKDFFVGVLETFIYKYKNNGTRPVKYKHVKMAVPVN